MKKLTILLVVIMLIAGLLAGCGIITDEEKIYNIIDEYFLAVSNQKWEKAKSYCIYNSEVYYETCNLEDYIDDLYLDFSFVDISFNVDIFDINIIADLAGASIDGSITIIKDDQVIIDDASGFFFLREISNNWKLYDWW